MNNSEKSWQNLADCLKNLIGILELTPESTLLKDAIALVDFLNKTTFQIAVFAPFNHGKSTLLNALLGQKSLPIDLIPSTGAAITIKYGQKTQTKIVFKDGTEQIASTTKILKEYAILDDARTMRNDVREVEVACNYPLLKNGVELLDLPGTNDREAQDDLVKDKLLTADLVLHVLDARKLMTLLEREKLRDWLQERGIHTVIFVVNFLNLLEPADRKKVYNRLKFVAESFRSQLPSGISNLYRVDALPALRARLQGDYTTVMETGLIDLETALQTIVKTNSKQPETRLTRIKSIGEKLIKTASEKKDNLQQQIEKERQKQQQKITIKQKAAQLIQQGLQRSISEFESWLYLPNLLKEEQAILAIAIQQNNFKNWKSNFNQKVSHHQQKIIEWLAKSQEFFPLEKPLKLIINFPNLPTIEKPDSQPKEKDNNSDRKVIITEEIDNIFNKAVQTILSGNSREFFASLTSNDRSYSNIDSIEDKPKKSLSQLYAEVSETYLTVFSEQAFISIKEYQYKATNQIKYQPETTQKNQEQEESQVKLLEHTIKNLRQELASI